MEQLIKSVYKSNEVKVLINEEATASNIERWFRIESGAYRGALSYLFIESLERNQPRLRDLAENIRSRRRWRR